MSEVSIGLARWLGMDPSEVVIAAWELVYKPDLEPAGALFKQALNDRTPYECMLRMMRHDRIIRWCAVYAKPVYDRCIFLGFRGVTVPDDDARIVLATATR